MKRGRLASLKTLSWNDTVKMILEVAPLVEIMRQQGSGAVASP